MRNIIKLNVGNDTTARNLKASIFDNAWVEISI
jgi:hypothetical protein